MIDAIAGRALVRDYSSVVGAYTTGNVTTLKTYTLPAITGLSAFKMLIETRVRRSELSKVSYRIRLGATVIRDVDMTGESFIEDSFSVTYQSGGVVIDGTSADPVPFGLGAANSYPSVSPAPLAWNLAATKALEFDVYSDPATGGNGNVRIDFVRVTVF
jgi:hypothetical protein